MQDQIIEVLFLNPPFLERYSRESRSPAVSKSGTLYYPMWLSYACGWLEKNGFIVDLIDAPVLDIKEEELIKRIKDESPFLVVSSISTPGVKYESLFLKKLKQEMPEVKIVTVGTHVSALPEQYLKEYPWIDFVAKGEYEETILDLAETLKNNGDISQVKGLYYRDGDEIKRNAPRPLTEDLDKFPFVSSVYKKYLNYKDYFYSHSRHPIVTIVTGRGCPYQCTYCVLPQTMMGHKLRLRSIENVVAEFKYIKEVFPDVKEIMIEDDTLTANKKRVVELSKRLIEEKINIPWSANSRADVDEETLRWMKKAGCRLLCVGFESGNQQILDNIKKNIKVEQFFKFRKAAQKANIMIHGCFLVGNRGETKETLKETLKLAKKLNPDTAQFFPIMVYPGTEAYRWAEANNFLTTRDFSEWLTVDGLHNCVVSTDKLTNKELVEFCDNARREFYLRPRYIFYKLIQSIRNPSEGKRNLKSFKTFFKYLILGSFFTEKFKKKNKC